MLFNSYEFLFCFLPVTLLAYFYFGHRGMQRAAVGVLVLASLLFYAWWNPVYLSLLLGSIAFNFVLGKRLGAHPVEVPGDRPILIFGVICNLLLLGYFKYAGFFVTNLNKVADLHLDIGTVLLPLGISFFTFTQIAYLVDAYRKEVREYHALHYLLFVTFFPHLIAGPVLHHAEIMPQFAKERTFRAQAENFSVGITILAIGLFKKVMLADSLSVYVGPAFGAAAAGETITGWAAWGAALAYTFQIYFDFSGYSDMAIGLARMCGIVFPANFFSPYKSGSIIEFWRRWHMTLSRFLRDYLYIPLGGGRRGEGRRYFNLIVTMLLGGLWHGAGWTFVLWGALHGAFLTVNHLWRDLLAPRLPTLPCAAARIGTWLGMVLTFICVVVAWVFFRADSVQAGFNILQAMSGTNGFPKNGEYFMGVTEVKLLLVSAAIVWWLPNVQQLMEAHAPVLDVYPNQGGIGKVLRWRPNFRWAAAAALMAVIAAINLTAVSEFLYFQF